jgi:hypothetical protein
MPQINVYQGNVNDTLANIDQINTAINNTVIDSVQVNDTLINLYSAGEKIFTIDQNPIFLYIAIGCLILFSILMVYSIWRYGENKKQNI